MTEHIDVCGSCAVVVANGDDSHIARGLDTIRANLDAFGWLTHVCHVGGLDNFTCDICERGQVGEHERFERDTHTPSDNRS